MDIRVLANLERGEVEAERLDLPRQVLDLAPRHAVGAVRAQGLADRAEIREELVGRPVGATSRPARADEPTTGSLQSLADGPERLAIWLPGKAPIEIGAQVGEASQPGPHLGGERRRHGGPIVRDRDRLLEPIGDVAVGTEDVVGLDPERGAGHLGGDPGMAVTVAADPCPPAHEGPGGRLARTAPILGPASVDECGVERSVQLRGDAEEGLVEEDHRGPDLVERGRSLAAGLRRLPQDRDLLPEATAQVAVLASRQPRIVEPIEQPIQPPLGDEHGATSRLGRVGGQDRAQQEPVEEGAQRIGSHVRSRQLADRIGDRLRQHAGPLATSERPHPVLLLGEVDEEEVGGEGPGHRQQLVERQSRERVGGIGVGRRLGMGASADRGSAKALHELEEPRSLLLDDHLPEEGAEELHLAGERVARVRTADSPRLGASRGLGGGRSRHAVLRLLSRGPRRSLRSAAARRRPRYSRARRGSRGRRSATTCRRRAGRGGSHRRHR